MIVDLVNPPAITRTSDHRYYLNLPDGSKYGPCPGVTSVLDVIDKSGPLMHWASGQTADAAIALHDQGWPELEAIVGREGVKKALMERRNWKRDEAATLGSAVHAWADDFVKGKLSKITPASENRVKAYAEWWENAGWKLRLSEFTVFDTKSEYGGTGDLLCYDREGRTVLADIKTGGKVGRKAYESEVLQLTAYSNAEYISPMGGTTVYPMPPVDRWVLLHVTEEGVREIEVNIGDRERIAWYAALALYKWMQATKGRLQ